MKAGERGAMKTTGIKLIALDMDDTLLTSDKMLTDSTRQVLAHAAQCGIEIVPATGRFFCAIPKAVRELSFLHYAITVNGAQIYDIRNDVALYKAEIPCEEACDIIVYMDQLDVYYDCYIDNWGWVRRSDLAKVPDYIENPYYQQMIYDFRTPVDSLLDLVKQKQASVQKIQFFTNRDDVFQYEMEHIGTIFPDVSVTAGTKNNLEINQAHANKGETVLRLASLLGLSPAETMGCGNDSNDISMIQLCGVGVAMGNASKLLKDAADYITDTCDNEGVAKAILRYCL